MVNDVSELFQRMPYMPRSVLAKLVVWCMLFFLRGLPSLLTPKLMCVFNHMQSLLRHSRSGNTCYHQGISHHPAMHSCKSGLSLLSSMCWSHSFNKFFEGFNLDRQSYGYFRVSHTGYIKMLSSLSISFFEVTKSFTCATYPSFVVSADPSNSIFHQNAFRHHTFCPCWLSLHGIMDK